MRFIKSITLLILDQRNVCLQRNHIWRWLLLTQDKLECFYGFYRFPGIFVLVVLLYWIVCNLFSHRNVYQRWRVKNPCLDEWWYVHYLLYHFTCAIHANIVHMYSMLFIVHMPPFIYPLSQRETLWRVQHSFGLWQVGPMFYRSHVLGDLSCNCGISCFMSWFSSEILQLNSWTDSVPIIIFKPRLFMMLELLYGSPSVALSLTRTEVEEAQEFFRAL
jgi:hypothetical protein